MYYNCKELHEAVKCKKLEKKKANRALWSLKKRHKAKDKVLRSGQCAEG